jgi:hypothetical protein
LPHANAAQTLHLVTETIKHKADLAFDALLENHAQKFRADDPDGLETPAPALDVNASEQFRG